MDSDNDESRSDGSCAAFWGPFTPLVGGHTLFEAATSSFAPTIFIAIARAIYATFMWVTFIVFAANGEYRMEFYSSWCHIGIALAFSLTSATSFYFIFRKEKERNGERSIFASLAVAVFQIFATCALFLDLVYWVLLFDKSTTPLLHQVAQHAVNAVFVVVDIFLSLRMQFKVFYGALFILFTVVYVIFAWIRYAITKHWVYSFLDYRKQSAGITVAYYFGMLAWGIFAAMIIFLFSRLSRCPCIQFSRGSSGTAADFEDDMGSEPRV